MSDTGTHFRAETDSDNIVWLHFDKAGSGTNTFSSEVLDELDQQLQSIAAECPRGLVILSDKANGFIAGADIESFTRMETEAQALAFLQHGQSVFNRLAAYSVPTVAMIHGFCLGGGTELALACRYRVTRDDPGTRLGLPEVRLGIHPGWGGSARLTPLVGGLKAMDLMLTGRSLAGRQAKRIGLVDRVVPERHLRTAARRLILDAPAPARPGLLDRFSNSFIARPLLAVVMQRQVAKRAPRAHYPAPYALIDIWRRHANDTGAMLEAEAQSVARLINDPAARNLIHVFFLQEQLKGLGRDSDYQPKYVHVVGAGTMGGDIASWCALRGFRVSLQDQSAERIAPAMQRAHALFKRKLKKPREIQAAMDRLMPDHRGVGVSRADIIIEAIFEDAEVKRSLYRDLEPRMKADAILATNTSSIPLEELAEALARPGQLVGLHFFNPVAKMQLVEVVNGASTAAEVSARALVFTRQIDRLLMEAVILESEGVAASLIDKAATGFGMPMGPVELSDSVGLDICLHVAEVLASHFNAAIPERLQQLVADGRLGRKSGRGFYEYRKGKAVKPKVSDSDAQLEEISDRLMLRLLNEAVSCVREQVVGSSDLLDAGMIFGTGFAPFRGGPMHHIQSTGPAALQARLQQFTSRYGERFTPDPGWDSLFNTQGD
jgi:3-hydroxyacyl-CoA dehydrogenase/enoyl-CoA hydratase/3-hydroxybutyryl-CoA epimerase